jgi:eukaryotic-like serine/threonine-protein kinase
MRRAEAAAEGHVTGLTLPPRGRATRAASGPGREIFRLPAGSEALGDRLLALGAEGVGGFVDGGLDGEGVWLVRRTDGARLAEALRNRKGPWPFREATAVARGLARALAACEAASLFPGPLTPDTVVLEGGAAPAAWLPAEALVRAWLGEPGARPSHPRAESALSPLCTPPAQADGAPWDAEANRYALGLVLYRLLAGEHPFGGAGLRHALGEAAHREAAPFAPAIAAALPAGLQSLTLRLLAPEASERPARALAIAEDLGALLGDASPKPADRRAPVERPRGRTGPVTTPRGRNAAASAPRRDGAPREAPARAGGAALVRFWPLLAGALIAGGALAASALLGPPPPAPTLESLRAPEAAPLTAAQTAATDCAACHARQAAEWRRSVMAHAVKSPLFNALESLIEEQVGRDDTCPNGAGVLRRVEARTACRDPKSGLPTTGAGGEHWCVNCHSPTEKLEAQLPPWEGTAAGDPRSRRPVRDLLGPRGMEGISCGFCHQVHGPVGGRGARGYQGNATWTSFITGATFAVRPEDARGLFGIGNSGYDLRPEDFLLRASSGPRPGPGDRAAPGAHLRPPEDARAYLRTSEFCGSCHDVRLFGTDAISGARGEHWKRLRNAYSEWAAWAKTETQQGRKPATCQGCHMSAYPGVCVVDPATAATAATADAKTPVSADAKTPATSLSNEGATSEASALCPPGTRLQPRAPGELPEGRVAETSARKRRVSTHYFSGVDLPLSREFPEALVDEPSLDLHGVPLSARRRRDLLLRRTFRFGLGAAARVGQTLAIPVEIENVGAGHRVPAGFSQEREFWVHLTVRDGTGRVLYEVGRVDRPDQDLGDKVMVRVSASPEGAGRDAEGRPQGLFGADVRDGPDAPAWRPPPIQGGASFRGKGLINFQNGFLRCVRCIGPVGPDGRCEAPPGEDSHRAARFSDGDYDLDTGACRSNLTGEASFFETYFPIGALDATRGVAKGPDAIIDTRSVPPGVPIRYTYELATSGLRGPFRVEARLLFRAFPPFLIRAFADYERAQAARGLRPSGPLVTADMLGRLEVVQLARATAEIR